MKKLLLIALLGTACTSSELAQVRDASDKRDTICAFAKAWSPDTPELQRVHELCDAGEDLKQIAAAYAGCAE